MLRRTDIPILWSDELSLFEDELHDNGVSRVTVKCRVMPTCIFVLLRFWLRVDGVLIRIRDTRLFHDLSKSYLLREYTEREATFEALVKVRTTRNPASRPPPPVRALNLFGIVMCCAVMCREQKGMPSTPEHYKDPNQFAQFIPLLTTAKHKIELTGGFGAAPASASATATSLSASSKP